MKDLLYSVSNQTGIGQVQYVVVNNNLTLTNVDLGDAPELPLEVALETVLTGWPQTYAIMDCQLLTGWFLLSSQLTIKNLIMLNLGRPIGELEQPGAEMSSGLWLFYPSSAW